MHRSWIPLTETGPRVTDEEVRHFERTIGHELPSGSPARFASSWAASVRSRPTPALARMEHGGGWGGAAFTVGGMLCC
jgi:hypothetical protein